MPNQPPELSARLVVARPDETLGGLLLRLPGDRRERALTYVVLPLADGRWIAVRWDAVERIVSAPDADPRLRRLMTKLASLPGLPEPVAALDLGGAALVVRAGGQAVGVLDSAAPLAEPLPEDPFPRPQTALPSYSVDEPDLPPPNTDPANQPGTDPAAGDTPGEPDTASAPTQPDTTPEQRVFNAWVGDLPRDQPLQLGSTYALHINVGAARDDARLTATVDHARLFGNLPPEQQQSEVLVLLESEDFTIKGDDQQTLTVPRAGESPSAVFQIEPQRAGPGTVKAFFYANGRVFQKMTITLQVGSLAPKASAWHAETRGITMGSAMAPQVRRADQSVNLMIVKKESGYQFILQSGGVTRAFLNLSETQVAELIASARDTLKGIVYTLVDNQYIYQLEDTRIPAETHAAALKALARLGVTLYRKLFYGPGSGPDARAMGDLLRQLSRQRQLQIEIVAERFIFPWSLLYDRDDLRPDLGNIDPQGFWGFKHVIEYTPEFSSATPVNFIPQISVGDKLGLGFVYNTTIDTQMGRPIIQGQRDFLGALDGIRLAEYANVQELFDLLNNPETPAQVLYFYCHAVSNLPGERGGVAGSKVVLSDGAVSLDDLNFHAPTDAAPLRQAPLVFMNCCQSAELSPYLYDGLVPYLIGKGARGVIGTEVDTPALFAAEFAQEFLRRFAAGGQPLGALLLDLRREYLDQKNNVMGLVYALYSSGEIVVQRAA